MSNVIEFEIDEATFEGVCAHRNARFAGRNEGGFSYELPNGTIAFYNADTDSYHIVLEEA